MKLLFDSTELSYYNEDSGHKAGVFYVALNLIKEFQKLGIDITFTCDYKRHYFMKNCYFFAGIPLLKENNLINKFLGWIIYKTNNFPIRFKYALLIISRYYDKYLYKINKTNLKQLEDFDVYFSPFTPPSKEISKSNLKRFRMIHDVIPIIEKGMPKSPKDWCYKIYSDINDKDFYVTNSVYTRQDVLKYFPFINENHIKTTLLGANEKFFAPSPLAEETTKCRGWGGENTPSPRQIDLCAGEMSVKPTERGLNYLGNDKYIFSLCTLGKRKNLIFGIRTFFEFIKRNNIEDLKLVLGGAVWEKYKHELNKELDKFDRSKVVLAGYIKEDELRNYYSNALCFIYPSLYEGFGLPVLEAMQCSCPVITSNRSSLPEVIGDCGIQVDPENEEEMIKAYEKFYFNTDFRKQCRLKGLERAKQFSWGKCAGEIIDFINKNIN